MIDISVADDLYNCDNTAERMSVIESFIRHICDNHDAFRAMSAWDVSIYSSPFKAITEKLNKTELEFFIKQLEEITGKKLF
jgi:hypothetical protein